MEVTEPRTAKTNYLHCPNAFSSAQRLFHVRGRAGLGNRERFESVRRVVILGFASGPGRVGRGRGEMKVQVD